MSIGVVRQAQLQLFVQSNRLGTLLQRTCVTAVYDAPQSALHRHASGNRASYGTSRKKGRRIDHNEGRQRRKEYGRDKPAQQNGPSLESVVQLREAMKTGNAADVLHLYKALPNKSLLQAEDVADVVSFARNAVKRLRRSPKAYDGELQQKQLSQLVQTTAEDFRRGVIEIHAGGIATILMFFQDTQNLEPAVELWNWLRTRDNHPACTLSVYGVAISILASHGSSLHELEELYGEALERFPGRFASYHMSSNAILSDRAARQDMSGLSMNLLRGIATARLLRGDTRQAYLTLDSGLRLLPDQLPEGFLTIFGERPPAEVFTILAVAHRAGVHINRQAYHPLFRLFRREYLGKQAHTVNQHFVILRAIVSMACMYMNSQSGRAAGDWCLSEVLLSLTETMRLGSVLLLTSDEKRQMARMIMSMTREILESFHLCNAAPKSKVFKSIIINVAAYGQSKDLIETVFNAAEVAGLQRAHLITTSLVQAAGVHKDAHQVRLWWEECIQLLALDGQPPSARDLGSLVVSCARTDQLDFADAEVDKAGANLGVDEMESLQAAILAYKGKTGDQIFEEELTKARETHRPLRLATFLNGLATVKEDLSVLREHLHKAAGHHNRSKQTLPMTFVSLPTEFQIPEKAHRAIYDQMTTERTSDQPPPVRAGFPTTAEVKAQAATSPAVSRTDIPLDQLRYENWKTINLLLHMSEKDDGEFQARGDKVADEVQNVAGNRLGGVVIDSDEKGMGLSDVESATPSQETGSDSLEVKDRIAALQRHIMDLRGMEEWHGGYRNVRV